MNSALPLILITLSQLILGAEVNALISKPQLGAAFFFDVNLSAKRNQSCATCHKPSQAFVDRRKNKFSGAISEGSLKGKFGTRNTPSLAYASLVPDFNIDGIDNYRGGFFHDGRAKNMAQQVEATLFNLNEMALKNPRHLLKRLQENNDYVYALKKHFGDNVFKDQKKIVEATASVIVAFQKEPLFALFTSRYDRYLQGEYDLSALEEKGRNLFFSDVTNCMGCHHSLNSTSDEKELFTDHRYHNIGLPSNPKIFIKELNRRGTTDLGLAQNKAVTTKKISSGKFRTPSLRNVAVTGPYMHNGVFNELRTAIHFYNHYIVTRDMALLNPETNKKWMPSEISENISTELLQRGQPISGERLDALVAFLKILTDKEYEHLINP
jgi:cytochrome c peroxidase